MVVPSCCWTAFSLVGTRPWMSTWSSVLWFECCPGAFRHFKSCIFLIFFGLVRRSVFFKDVSAGSLVFAFPTLTFSCSKVTVSPLASMFSSWQPKMRQPGHFCCCLCGLPAFSGCPLGSFWAVAGNVFGVSNFPGRPIFRVFCAWAGFLRCQRVRSASCLRLNWLCGCA